MSDKRRRVRRRTSSEELLRDRVCWRISEFSQLTGLSRPTIWRQAKANALHLTYINKTPVITRNEAIRLGLIQ